MCNILEGGVGRGRGEDTQVREAVVNRYLAHSLCFMICFADSVRVEENRTENQCPREGVGRPQEWLAVMMHMNLCLPLSSDKHCLPIRMPLFIYFRNRTSGHFNASFASL